MKMSRLEVVCACVAAALAWIGVQWLPGAGVPGHAPAAGPVLPPAPGASARQEPQAPGVAGVPIPSASAAAPAAPISSSAAGEPTGPIEQGLAAHRQEAERAARESRVNPFGATR